MSNWSPADSLNLYKWLTVVISTSWCSYSYSNSPQEGLSLFKAQAAHTPDLIHLQVTTTHCCLQGLQITHCQPQLFPELHVFGLLSIANSVWILSPPSFLSSSFLSPPFHLCILSPLSSVLYPTPSLPVTLSFPFSFSLCLDGTSWDDPVSLSCLTSLSYHARTKSGFVALRVVCL